MNRALRTKAIPVIPVIPVILVILVISGISVISVTAIGKIPCAVGSLEIDILEADQ